MNLTELANFYKIDKGTLIPDDGQHHGPRLHFTTIYDRELDVLKNEKISMLEIGISTGFSLKMWHDFFPNAMIYGMDILDCKQHDDDRVKTLICDQSNREDLTECSNFLEELDLIIDDGGHMMKQQQVSLGVLFKKLKPGGIYFIEDLHTSFWPYGPYEDLYGTPLDINVDRTNTTVKMLEGFLAGNVHSEFMTNEEMEYLKNHMSSCEIFDLPHTEYGPNKLAMLKKK